MTHVKPLLPLSLLSLLSILSLLLSLLLLLLLLLQQAKKQAKKREKREQAKKRKEKREQAKKREYGDRIREVENASFTPLVFSTTGGLSKETSIAYKRMAELLAIKRKTEYSTTLAWMRCSLSFALIRSAVACIRGTRVSLFRHASETNIELGYGESRLFSI